MLHNPEPFTEYEFRVRCGFIHENFENIIMSNWSLYTAETPPAGKKLPFFEPKVLFFHSDR